MRILEIIVREYSEHQDIVAMIQIWNEIIEEGIAFPQEEYLDENTAKDFFKSQTYCGVAIDSVSEKMCGLYILHPNNVGRCGHLCNTSFAVSSNHRGMQIGEKLVRDSLIQAKRLGFRIMQFNAVVESNIYARRLYEKIGFIQLGIIPKGFRMKDGHYENIYPYYYEL